MLDYLLQKGVRLLLVGCEGRHHPLDGVRVEVLASVDALAEAREAVFFVGDAERPVGRHVGDEEEAGVGADVDGGNAQGRCEVGSEKGDVRE